MPWSREEDFFLRNTSILHFYPKITSLYGGGHEIYNFLSPYPTNAIYTGWLRWSLNNSLPLLLFQRILFTFKCAFLPAFVFTIPSYYSVWTPLLFSFQSVSVLKDIEAALHQRLNLWSTQVDLKGFDLHMFACKLSHKSITILLEYFARVHSTTYSVHYCGALSITMTGMSN